MTAKPSVFSIDELEAHSSALLPKIAREYFNGAALDGVTLRANRSIYERYAICPRVLRDVSKLRTSRAAIPGGYSVPFPCAVAPMAMQRMAHPDGELAMARACAKFGTVMGLSSFSTTSLEDVKQAADEARISAGLNGESECVLQLYLFEDRKVSERLVKRAEEAGYKAVVLTVDTPQFGRRLSELRNQFKLPPHLRIANFDNVKTGSELRTDSLRLETTAIIQSQDGQQKSLVVTQAAKPASKNDPSLTWEVVPYLRSITTLPIWLKGIMNADDARLAVQHGADAIMVSNHGGRQLDGAPPTLRVLPDIVKAVEGRIPVHFDGGVRRGSDIFKALCLGADIVWIGRPALWGLAYDGQSGVATALEILEAEFRDCMSLSGCATLEDLGPDRLMAVDW